MKQIESEEYKEIQKKRFMKFIEVEDSLFEINGWISVADFKENYRKRQLESLCYFIPFLFYT